MRSCVEILGTKFVLSLEQQEETKMCKQIIQSVPRH